MTARPDTNDYRAIFLAGSPIMDMRAPTEFAQGAFPNATSLPLMSDEERAQVGTRYKQQGQQAAIELGHQLVAGQIKDQRLAAWADFANTHSKGYLYCFRGGLRSRTVQQWLLGEGIDYPLIEGGYKAMRRFLIDELERSVKAANFVLISGKTGTGKTRVVWELDRAVDLEGRANHRGSTFGQLPQPQPSQIDFENTISIDLLRMLEGDSSDIYLEDEGRLIGRLYVPDVLREQMEQAPMAVVEQSMDERVDVVIADYVVDLGQRYAQLHGEQGPALHAQKLQDDLSRVKKRLGGERHQMVSGIMAAAFQEQQRSGDLVGHREWIAFLLEKYYDPMYEYQLDQRKGRQIFHGSREQVLDWAKTRTITRAQAGG